MLWNWKKASLYFYQPLLILYVSLNRHSKFLPLSIQNYSIFQSLSNIFLSKLCSCCLILPIEDKSLLHVLSYKRDSPYFSDGAGASKHPRGWARSRSLLYIAAVGPHITNSPVVDGDDWVHTPPGGTQRTLWFHGAFYVQNIRFSRDIWM